MTPTPLTPTNLYAVSVPKGAKDFTIQPFDTWTELYWKEPFYNFREVGRMRRIEGIFTLVGLVTKDTIDFDAHLYVSTHFNGLFTNYEQEDENASDAFVETPEDSFRSLLSANECFFENPLGDEPKEYKGLSEIEGRLNELDIRLWDKAQSKVHECWAIIEKV